MNRHFFSSLVFLVIASRLWSDPCPTPEGAYIDSIKFEGLRQTHPNVVKNALENRKGQGFSCAAWERERNRLRDLDIFAKVEITAVTTGDSVSLTYRFRELPPYVPLASITNTDQDGLSIGPSVAALNFLGTGDRADVMARFGGTTEYQADISGRQIFGHSAEFEAAWIHVDSYNPFDSAHEYSHRVKTEDFWPLLGSRHFGVIGYAEYFFIQLNPDTMTYRGVRTPLTLRPGGDWVPRLGAGFRWDTRDRALLPRSGFFAETRLTQNGGEFGGPANFWEALADLRAYFPLTRRQGFTLNALYQYRDGIVGKNLALYDIFYAGGVNTLRGYSDGEFYGQDECLLNAEYRFDALEERVQRLGPWSLNYGVQLVAGVDAASLWDDSLLNEKAVQPRVFHPSVYCGVHLLVPGMERIRLEIGSKIARFDLMVNFGLFEKTTAERFRTR